jgi:hypothetical protein
VEKLPSLYTFVFFYFIYIVSRCWGGDYHEFLAHRRRKESSSSSSSSSSDREGSRRRGRARSPSTTASGSSSGDSDWEAFYAHDTVVKAPFPWSFFRLKTDTRVQTMPVERSASTPVKTAIKGLITLAFWMCDALWMCSKIIRPSALLDAATAGGFYVGF